MEDVACLAEVGKGTLYRYFKDKEEMYLALLDRSATGLQERMCRAMTDSSCPRKRLVGIGRFLMGRR